LGKTISSKATAFQTRFAASFGLCFGKKELGRRYFSCKGVKSIFLMIYF